MNTLEQLKEKHAKETAKLERELAIAALAPVTPKRVLDFNPMPWLIYERETLTEALAVMNAAPIVTFQRTKAQRGRFTRLWPWSIAAADKRDNWEDISGPWACSIKVDQGNGFGPTVSLHWFVRCGDKICAAHCDIQRGFGPMHAWQYGAQFYLHNPNGERSASNVTEIRANNTLAAQSDEYVKWGTGDRTSASFEYLWIADSEAGETDHATAMIEQLERVA